MVRARVLYTTLLLLALLGGFAVSSLGEEFVLKDGSKILGRMVSVKGDSLEVQTQYGKVKLKRSDIVTINFPENQPAPPAEAAPAPPEAPPPVEHTLEGTTYTNRTGSFTLTLPEGWKISEEIRQQTPASLAGLVSGEESQFVLVVQERFPGSLRAYKETTELLLKENVPNYEKVDESELAIQGKPTVLISFKGLILQPRKIPIRYLVAIIDDDGIYTGIQIWCIEPLFDESRKTFEEIIFSYRTFHKTTPPS